MNKVDGLKEVWDRLGIQDAFVDWGPNAGDKEARAAELSKALQELEKEIAIWGKK